MILKILYISLFLLTLTIIVTACQTETMEQTSSEQDANNMALTNSGTDISVSETNLVESENITEQKDSRGDEDDTGTAKRKPVKVVPSTEYIVLKNDILSDIALKFNTTVDMLLKLNRLDNPNELAIGQKILIPSEPTSENEIKTPEPDELSLSPEQKSSAEMTEVDQEVTGMSPSGIPQPGTAIVLSQIPEQPVGFSKYATAALPWLQNKTEVDEIVPLFTTWPSPPVRRGDRLNIVDTNLDGNSSLVIIFTNPGSFGEALTTSNLIIYDPAPGLSGRYQIAYDHNLRLGRLSANIGMLLIGDITGNGKPEITFQDEDCDGAICTSSFYSLSKLRDGYQDIVETPIRIPAVSSVDVLDETGDGLQDLEIETLINNSTEGGPSRMKRLIYSAKSGTLAFVRAKSTPTHWLILALADANSAFEKKDDATAIALYERVLTDSSLKEWITGESAELIALARIRRSLALARIGHTLPAIASAQAATSGTGLIAQASLAFLNAFVQNGEITSGCAAFNVAFRLYQEEWKTFWGKYQGSIPQLRANDICPF